ncbi:MAG: metal ABC transporter substrate-binding protein [Treponema sp.]|nr:metal ABC transporter substrate-binding protein [Treponema sp.]
MKRAILLLITLAALLSGVVSCRPNKNAAAQNGKINITVTNFPPYDFVRQIAGDRVNLNMLLPPGSESHSFEPSPRDIITIQNSDIFIYVGGGSDKWIDRILQSMNTGSMKILAMIDMVEAVDEEIVEGMEEDGDDTPPNGGAAAYDEHVWTSPKNAILIVQAITETLCETDAANAVYYRQNAAAYIEELRLLDIAFAEVVSNSKRSVIVFADRFPFRYLADAYGLTYYAAFPGCSTDTEPSAATVKFLIDKIRAEQIPVVFHIELSNERMANTISGATGAKKLLLHSGHNITKRDFDSGLGYIKIMENNIENLREALN